MRKVFFLIPLLVLVSLIPLSLAQNHDNAGLEECREGLIIVYLINSKSYSCKSPETAERWVELGIGEIIDKNYNPDDIIEPVVEPLISNVTEPESILKIPEELLPELNFHNDTNIQVQNTTNTITPEPEVIEEVPIETPKPTKQSNKNPLPGTPRKVGSQGIQAFGSLVLEVYDQDGKLKHRHVNHNLVVTVGLQALSDLAFGTTHVSGESAGGFSYISVGTGGTAPATGNTDCQTQHGSKKQDVSITNTALGAVINVSWIAELPAGTLQEICLTDDGAVATGNLFSRQTFAGVPILGTDTINAEWTITFADSDGS